MPLARMIDTMRAIAAPLTPAPAVVEALVAGCREQTLAKGDHLVRVGDPVDTLWYVSAGLLRYYYLSDGREHTGQFFGEAAFVTDAAGFLTGQPAVQSFDALVETTVVRIPRSVLTAAYDADHALERVGRRLIEEALIGAQRRSASLLTRSPEERYADLIRLRPEIVRQVPQYVIASYLGVTPESLSRIRARRVADG